MKFENFLGKYLFYYFIWKKISSLFLNKLLVCYLITFLLFEYRLRITDSPKSDMYLPSLPKFQFLECLKSFLAIGLKIHVNGSPLHKRYKIFFIALNWYIMKACNLGTFFDYSIYYFSSQWQQFKMLCVANRFKKL